MEYKNLPFRKRKLDMSILLELGILPASHEQLNAQCGQASTQTDVTSLVPDAVREQDRYLTIERRVSKFNRNLYPESAKRSRMSLGDDNCNYPETEPVKMSQDSHDTDGASEGMPKLLKASAACSTDSEVFCNPQRVLMKDADEDVDKLDCPSMPSDKAAHVASERIWEGSIQFSTNAIVPILTFFKSGQKLLDINWSSLMVIKGKLPFEDFKNYIKDLPLSRYRKLMVISLCWKMDSSTEALKSLKEVVKHYETAKLVGYAQPSPDVKLYLSPWNEVISTTLVKCGYLEEKVAVADKSELLIGCVVWGKNQITSGSLLNRSELQGTYSLTEQDRKPPTGANQTTTNALLKLPETKGVEPLKVQQGFKSSIKEDQKNSGSLLEQSKNQGARLLMERESRLLKLQKNKEVEPLKEQGFKSSIGRDQKNSGSLSQQSNYGGARPLKKPESRGGRQSKEQEVWSPVRTSQTSSIAVLEQRTGDCTRPWKGQGLKFQNEHTGSGSSNLPSKDSKGQQLKTAPTSAVSSKAEYSTSSSDLPRTITLKPFFKVEETAVGDFGSSPDKIAVGSSLKTSSSGKFISERYNHKNPCAGNDNYLPRLTSSMLKPSAAVKIEPSASGKIEPRLTSSMLKPSAAVKIEPSAAGKIEPSLPLHSNSFKKTYGNLPVYSPLPVSQSEFPIRLESSNEQKRRPVKILPPVPDPRNSLARHFTYLPNPNPPSGSRDVPKIVKRENFR